MRQHVSVLDARRRQRTRSTAGVLVAVTEEPGPCPICVGSMEVQKTIRRHGMTLEHGPFEVRETVHVCGSGCRHCSGALVTRRAVSLAQRIPPGSIVGYDVMVFVGLQRFLQFRQRDEIRTALLCEHGLSLSSGDSPAISTS